VHNLGAHDCFEGPNYKIRFYLAHVYVTKKGLMQFLIFDISIEIKHVSSHVSLYVVLLIMELLIQMN
jgi:hypothetical protein